MRRGTSLIARSPIPGLGISAGVTITLLTVTVLLPIGALLLKGAVAGPAALWAHSASVRCGTRQRYWFPPLPLDGPT